MNISYLLYVTLITYQIKLLKKFIHLININSYLPISSQIKIKSFRTKYLQEAQVTCFLNLMMTILMTSWWCAACLLCSVLTNHDTNLQYPPIMTVPLHPLPLLQNTKGQNSKYLFEHRSQTVASVSIFKARSEP